MGCRDPGFVCTNSIDRDSKLKSKVLTHADFSQELSINPHISPKFKTSRTLQPNSYRSSEDSSNPNSKIPMFQFNGEASLENSKEPTEHVSEEFPESKEAEEEADYPDQVAEVPDLDIIATKKAQPPKLIIERRYCTACKIEQPIRAKHCKVCKSCVALHDHHCPWIGICIGERNRRAFFWYLLAQNIELWWTLIRVCMLFEMKPTLINWIEVNAVRLGLAVGTSFFIVMLTCLLVFHSYLACSNRTTCKLYLGEHVSWEKVSYLKEWPVEYKSPFSRGCLSNLYMYCVAKVPRPYRVWELPLELPEKPPKDCLLM